MNRSRVQRAVRVAAALALGACAWPGFAERNSSEALQHDVFSRPSLSAVAPERAAPIEAEAWRPNLRAIVLAGDRSLVLVDRSTVAIGGVVDGYRLVGVADGRATFVRGARRVELTMGPTKKEAR